MQGHSSHLQASTVATPLTLNLDEDVTTLGCYLTDFIFSSHEQSSLLLSSLQVLDSLRLLEAKACDCCWWHWGLEPRPHTSQTSTLQVSCTHSPQAWKSDSLLPVGSDGKLARAFLRNIFLSGQRHVEAEAPISFQSLILPREVLSLGAVAPSQCLRGGQLGIIEPLT